MGLFYNPNILDYSILSTPTRWRQRNGFWPRPVWPMFQVFRNFGIFFWILSEIFPVFENIVFTCLNPRNKYFFSEIIFRKFIRIQHAMFRDHVNDRSTLITWQSFKPCSYRSTAKRIDFIFLLLVFSKIVEYVPQKFN